MFRKAIWMPMTIILLWFIGYLMLALVYCIPTEKMEKHLQESVSTFVKEGSYPMITDIGISRLDNYTDALMLLVAAYPEKDNVWVSSLYNTRYSNDGENPVQTLVSACGELGGNKLELQAENYPRYWHGYLLFLKPLLYFFDYTQIRYIIMFVQLSLFAFLVSSLSSKKHLIFPMIFMWAFLNPIATMCSIQYNTIFLLTFSSMIFIVHKDIYWKKALYKWGFFFMVIGGLTSYFDLLTYPMVTLGAPLTLWLSLNMKSQLFCNLKNIFLYFLLWLIGYGGMWTGKWIMGSIIIRENLIQDAFQSIHFRISSNAFGRKIKYRDVIESVMNVSWKYICSALILICILFMFKTINSKKLDFKHLLEFIVIGIFPFGWYLILKNHTFIHYWFTYREMAVTIFAIMVWSVNKQKYGI